MWPSYNRPGKTLLFSELWNIQRGVPYAVHMRCIYLCCPTNPHTQCMCFRALNGVKIAHTLQHQQCPLLPRHPMKWRQGASSMI